FDSLPQNINVLLVNTRVRTISLVYSHEKNVPASIQASKTGSIAAINGGFFNVRDGGSVTYIKTAGTIVDSDTSVKWRSNSNFNGSVLVDNRNRFYIMPFKGNNWYDTHAEFPDVLVTGPLLIKNNIKIPLPATSLVTNRHPRTCAGARNSSRVLLVTVDGRTSQAAGMTLDQLASLMLFLRCKDAVNLDGGGSTTMWIRGKPYNGVVNMLCDNKIFDHQGERAVSNIIAVK
ncbi:MAG: phosphodiester glycosidase family protein, partial [Bacteroidales bacterium]